MTNSTNDLVQLGFIRGAHALKGQVMVHIFSGNEEAVADYGPLFSEDGKQSFEFMVTGAKQGDFICSVKGINDRNASEALKGIKLFIPADALPELDEDEFYIKDLIGLTVLDASGTTLGKVKHVNSFGEHDALEIQFIHDGQNPLEKPQSEFVLFTKENVPNLNPAAGTLTLTIPAGLFEEVEKTESK